MSVQSLAHENEQCRRLRTELNKAEIGLRDQRERVAALRPALPGDSVYPDQEFVEWRDRELRQTSLSGLFTQADKPLILMHLMYGANEHVCPMCAMWAEGYNALMAHILQFANFAVLIAGDSALFSAVARQRGWTGMRVVSAAKSPVKRELGFEHEHGGQMPGVSVFSRGDAGEIVHHYSQSAMLADGEFRGVDLLNPVWHFLDLLPNGRGD
jgi:predicted dithiol-disulfide oxidoreductase (DUF899 family)